MSWLGTPAFFFDSLPSTNRYAKALPGEAMGALVVAWEQTDGYGSKGRAWASKAGESLTFSFLLPWAEGASIFPLVVGVACASALQALGVPVRLKWPNDLVLFDGKVGGILVESVFGERAIAGIGLNLRLPSRLAAPEAASLDGFLLPEPSAIIDAIAHSLETRWDRLLAGEVSSLLAEWQALSCTLGQQVLVLTESGQFRGEAVGLDPLGGLVLMTERGAETIYSGTVRSPGGRYV